MPLADGGSTTSGGVDAEGASPSTRSAAKPLEEGAPRHLGVDDDQVAALVLLGEHVGDGIGLVDVRVADGARVALERRMVEMTPLESCCVS